MKIAVIILGLSAVALAQQRGNQGRNDNTTPVPILRQINTVSEDGSYTYGYEGADGSYKIENKAKNGEVTGKYGYYDDQGTLREVQYGASRLGFNPTGTDINAPALPDHVNQLRGQDSNDNDDGTYDAARYERPYDHLNAPRGQDQAQAAPARKTRPRGQKRLNLNVPQHNQQQYTQYQQQPQQQQYQQPQQQQYQQPQQQYNQYQAQPQQYQPQPQAPRHQQPFNQQNLFHGHPARNIDINTGSYSINY